MSRFYLLPSRAALGERFAGFLESFFPGLDLGSEHWPQLAEAFGSVAGSRPDTYVVYREELPADEDPATALCDGFGASSGDEVIEVVPGKTASALATRRWRVGPSA